MILGLTGGIGSGKTTVARLFTLLGWSHFSSDETARQLYFDPQLKPKITQLLGAETYSATFTLNKKFISDRIFADAGLLKKLNEILHPAVALAFTKFLRDQGQEYIIKESALLFEVGLEKNVDRIVMVSAPDEIRIKRVMERDNLSKEDVLAKIGSQWPQSRKEKLSHFVILNDEEHSLIEQVLHIHQELNKG